MIKHESRIDKRTVEMQTSSLNSLEAKCLIQLDTTLHNYFVESKTAAGSSAVFTHFKEVFLKLNSESSNGRCLNNRAADNSCKVNHAVQYLKDINGVFFVLDGATKTCVVARSFSTLSETKLIQQNVNKFVHEDDQFYFDLDADTPKNKEDSSSKQLKCFDCRFRMECGISNSLMSENCEPFYSFNMSCIKFVDRFNEHPCTGEKAEGSFLIMCVASQAKNIRSMPTDVRSVSSDIRSTPSDKAPPNQTISTREKIPKPIQFCTVQNINGVVERVCLSLSDVKQFKKTNIPGHLKDDVSSSLLSFFSTGNGSLSKALLKQVLNHGKGSCRLPKFSLKDGNIATLVTKSELVSQSASPRDHKIISTHLIYREATLKDLNVKGLPKTLLSSIPVPPVTLLSSSDEATVTMTTSSIATTSSFSSNDFLTSSHYAGQSMKNESYLGDPSPSFAVWPREARNSLESTKDFLSEITKTEAPFEDLNGVVSPPPHLDGHLVHTIGRPKNAQSADQLLSPTPSNFYTSRTSSVNSTTLPSLPADIAGGFLPKMEPDAGLLNPGTFSGPPCVDLGTCDITPKSEIVSLPTSSSLMLINGITTMKKEAATPPAKPQVPAPNSTAMSSPSVPTLPNPSFSHPRECVTPDKARSLSQTSSPKRPRSASINTSNANSGALKRSSSTLSEDSGIGDFPHGNKSSPHRFKVKDKVKSSKQPKLLTELLTAQHPDDVKIAFSSTSSSSKSAACKTSTMKTIAPSSNQPAFSKAPISSNLSKTSSFNNSLTQSSVLPPSTVPNQTSTVNSVSNPKTSHLGGISNNFLGNVTNASQHQPPNDNLSESLDEIFDCYESIIGNSSSEQQLYTKINDPIPSFGQDSASNVHPVAQQNPSMPQQRTSAESNPGLLNSNIQPNLLLSPVNNSTIQNIIPSPQPLTPNSVLSPQQAMPRPPSGNSLAFRRIVPTDQETCPNRIVGSGVMISPKAPTRTPSTAQYGGDFGATEKWAGKEPLVDLGTIPPPSGINPRMTIPSQLQMNQPSGMPVSNPMQPSANPHFARNSSARMQFHSPNNAIVTPPMQINMQTGHQQNLNHGMAPNNPSHGGFPNAPSPNTFPHMQASGSSLNTSPRPGYNNMQPQRAAVAGNIRARLLRQQPRPNPPPPYQGDVSPLGSSSHYNFTNKPEMSRYIAPQRPNGAMLRQPKPAPLAARSNPSPSTQVPFNQMNNMNSNRFPTNQPAMGQYSPMGSQQQNHFPNPTFNNDLPSSINFDHGLRPQVIMGSQNSNQFNCAPTESFNTMGNPVGQRMSNNFPVEPLNSPPNVLPMGKPQLKRSRSKKATRKKIPADDGSWVGDDMNNTISKQRPLMQMTIGNMHQRPQPTFNSPLDGALQPNNSVMSAQGGGSMQTLNLNLLMNQNKSKVGFDGGVSSFHTLPNRAPQHCLPNRTQSWNDPFKNDANMTSGILDDILDVNMSSRPSSYSLDGIPTVESHASMNTNVNNNNNSDIASHLRYTATATMLPGASGVPLQSPEKKKKHIILESLLLKDD